ncbi:MAG: sulfatase-like hydrolase/transferase [Akkermansiaceae bacterium]
MNRLISIWICLFCLSQAAEKPNVVVIFCDDMGYGDVGCFGAKGWKTPHIDSIAENGVKLTDFYVAQPVCSASRTALLTGCYPNRLGISGALSQRSTVGIHEDETTLAELCQSQGYATAMYGKWHLGYQEKFLPVKHGFDDYFGYPYSNDMWPSGPVRFVKSYPLLPLIEDDEIVARVRDQTWMTTWITERSVQFIKNSKDKPFFLYLAHPQPHVPLYTSPTHAGSSEQGKYGDVMHEIDWSTGEVLKALEQTGVVDNTMVIFTSDNGPWMVYGNHAGGVGPLRGCKGNCWDGGVRVPCVMQWPAKLKGGSVVKTPLMTIDVLPTIAGLIGAPLPKKKIDGKDAWKVISGEQTEPVQEAYFFYYRRNNLEAMRMGKWKLQFPHKWRNSKISPANDGHAGKYVTKECGLELYDLEADPGESNNLSKEHPEVVKTMQALADKKRAELGDELLKIKGKENREPGRAEIAEWAKPKK